MEKNKILGHLKKIYGQEVAKKYRKEFENRVSKLSSYRCEGKREFDEKDSIMITYGDSISGIDGEN